jgi:hypothetical protein
LAEYTASRWINVSIDGHKPKQGGAFPETQFLLL